MGGSFQSSFSKGIECSLSFFSFNHSFIREMLAECLACGKERKEKNYVIEASSRTMETGVQLDALKLWIKEFIVLLVTAVVKEFPAKCVLGEDAF